MVREHKAHVKIGESATQINAVIESKLQKRHMDLINLFNHNDSNDIETISTVVNRSKTQTNFLYELLNKDFKLLVVIELAIMDLHYCGCPSTKEEVSKIVDRYIKKYPNTTEFSENPYSKVKKDPFSGTFHGFLHQETVNNYFYKWLDNVTVASVLDGFDFDVDNYEKLVGYYIDDRLFSPNCIEKEVQFIVKNKDKYKFSTKRKLVLGGMGHKSESDILTNSVYDYLIKVNGFKI